MGIRGFLTTLGLGAGAMYFFDPDQGNRRRALLRDQVTGFRNDMTELWEAGTRDLENRAQGFQAEVRSKMSGSVNGDGKISGMPQMLGTETTWPPGTRLVALAGGSLMALYGMLRGGISGKLVTLAGLNFASRGMFNKSLMSVFKPSAEGGISVQKDLHINAPVEEVFDFWRNYDNFPRFMSHLEEVRDLGGGRSHWVAKGPVDAKVEWDATVTQLQPNRVIAWESEPGSEVYNAGRVRFTPAGEGTHLSIHMAYSPPGGAVGHAVAAFFGADAKSAMDDDLSRLKGLLEKGKTGSGGSRSSGGRQGGSTQANPGRESGKPGGGQGRQDVVGQTGVYPASGPMPEGDADVQGMASWGQGERGAAGYEDSGRSELNLGNEPKTSEEKKPGSGGSSGSGRGSAKK